MKVTEKEIDEGVFDNEYLDHKMSNRIMTIGEASAYKLGLIDGCNKQAQSMNEFTVVPYQCCPICNGTGKILADGFTSSVFHTCKVCNGSCVIPQCVVPPPPQT